MANQAIPSDQSLLFFQKIIIHMRAQNYTWTSNGQQLVHSDTYDFYNNNADTGTSFALGGCPTTYHGSRLYGGGINEVLIFNHFLTETEVAKVNYYLSKKWGLETTVDSDGDNFMDDIEETLGTSPIDATDIPGVDFSNSVDAQIGEASGFDSIESNLALWLDATNIDLQSNATLSDGDTISEWRDLSGNGNSASQAELSRQGIFNSDSNNINFDGFK